MKKILMLIISVCLLTACASSDIVATVGKTKITKGEFEFYLSSIKNQLSGTELQTDEDWETQEIEGEKAIDVAKQRALEIAVNNAEYSEIAKAHGIKLSDADKQQIESTKQQIISGYGGEDAYNAFLKENNISDKFIQMICESTTYYQKITEEVKAEAPITEEETLEYFNKEKSALGTEYRKAKHILFLTQDAGTGTAYTEEKQLSQKELADKVYEQLQNGADFDTLMNEYTEDPGLAANPDGYVFSSGEMVAEFEQAVDSVSFGEITMCKTNYGYHIIKRLPIGYDDIKEKLESKVLKERVSAKIKEWEKEYKLTITTNEELIKSIK